MKFLTFFMLLAFTACAAEDMTSEWIGKIVAIKTTSGGTSGILIKNYVPVFGPQDKANPDASFFKVVAGTGPATIAFESVANPGMYLRHGSFHLLLHKDIIDESSYHVTAPVHGNQGVSLQSYNFPTRYINITDKDHIDLFERGKDLRRANFVLEERKK